MLNRWFDLIMHLGMIRPYTRVPENQRRGSKHEDAHLYACTLRKMVKGSCTTLCKRQSRDKVGLRLIRLQNKKVK